MAIKRFRITDAEAADIVRRRADVHGQRTERRALDQMVVRNRAFFMGRHHFIEDTLTGRLREPTRLPPYAVQYKANFIKGDVLRAIATVAGAQADFVVAPEKNSRTARHAAWVSEKLFQAISARADMPELDQLAALIAAMDGSVIWRVTWNPDIGDKTRFYFADEKGSRFFRAQDLGDEERAYKDRAGLFEDRAQGDVDFDLVNLWGSQWDWSARDRGLRDAKWFCHSQFVDFDFLEERYGEDALDGVVAEDLPSGSLYFDELMAHMTSSYGARGFGQGLAVAQDKAGRRAILSELWEVPLPSNGMMGRKIVTAGTKTFENGPNPYREIDTPLPFFKQDWVKCPSRFWGLSLVEDLISPQQQYNRMRANMAEHTRIFGHPAFFFPKGSGLKPGYFSVQPGMAYEYDGPRKPEAGPTPNLPKEVGEHTMMARSEISEISSQQSLDASKLPGQIRSAPGLDLMVEERNKALGHPAQNFVLTKAHVGRHMLALARVFYPEERVLRYVGEDRKFRVVKFYRADINSDMRVLYDRSRMLQSPSAVRAKVMEMAQLGIIDPINNPDDKEAVLKALEFGSVTELVSDRLQEEENQEREIEEMIADPISWMQTRADMMAPVGDDGAPAQVQGYPIGEFDDDRAHLKFSIRFIRSEEFRRLDPVTQSLIVMHTKAHEAREQARQQQAMMMQQALQGGGAAKGRPSQPRQPAPAA